MIGRIAAALAVVGVLATAVPRAQTPIAQEELTVSPYALLHGARDLAERIERREQLAAIAQSAGDAPRAARHYALACQDRDGLSGQRTLAWESCRRARALAAEHDLLDVRVQLLSSQAVVRLWSLNFAGAAETAREAIALGAAIDPAASEYAAVAIAHLHLGSALAELGRFDEARAALSQARDRCRALGNAQCAALADLYLCRMHAVTGDFPAARAACDVARTEASIDDDVLVLMNHEWMVATLESMVGRPQASLEAAQRAWTHAQVRGAEGMRPVLALMIVDALVRLKRIDEAETWQRGLEDGLGGLRIPMVFGPQISFRRGQIAEARGRLEEAEAAFARSSRSRIHEMSIRGYLAAARLTALRGELRQARESLEQAIARIETGRTNVSGSALRAGYLALHANAYRALAGVRYDADGETAAAEILEIAEAGRSRALLDALGSAQLAGTAAPVLSAAEMQAAIGPDDVLVEYVSSESRLLAIVVTRDRLKVVPLPGAGTADELAKRVDFFSALVQESAEPVFERPAARLYEDVLAPVLADAAPHARTLIIAADGPLHRLPFDALGSPRLIDRWNVVTVPSASILARPPHADRASAALVVAASAEGLAPLTAADDEAAAIRSRIGGTITEFSGARATRANVTGQPLDQYAVLHFASHAVADEERPLRSALMLSGDDGRWTAEDIYRQTLRADLVVLSACSTAAGANAPGEGVMSLSRAFLHAGASATVATLWDVPDAPGPVFADGLYRRLAAGEPLGAAAAEARRELRRRGAPPRAWAAYTVTGNPATRVSISPATTLRVRAAAISGAVTAVLLIASLALRRDRAASVRLRRTALATATVCLAVVATGVLGWPRPDLRGPHERVPALRGQGAAVPAVTIAGGRATWNAVPGADEHLIEVFDAEGSSTAMTSVAVTAVDLPPGAGGWIRVEARRGGQRLWRSALIPRPQ